MKYCHNNTKLLFTFIAMLLLNIAFAQVPNAIPYQAVARNSSGAILASANISVRFTVRDSTATGVIKYSETHAVTTSVQGMFSLNIGQGTAVTGTFNGINWGVNSKFMQVEIDPTGGSSYIDMGTQQMLSVPYALFAKNTPNSFTHYVGEIWGGGVVYHVYKGTDGIEHGLIVAPFDQCDNTVEFCEWGNILDVEIGLSAQSTMDGLTNSNAIVAQTGHIYSAAKICLDLELNGYNDWYLPSQEELRLLIINKYTIYKSFSIITGAVKFSDRYWSSTETNHMSAVSMYMYETIGYEFDYSNKYGSGSIRAIRSF